MEAILKSSSMTGIVSRHDKNWIVVCTKSKHMLIIEEINNSKGKYNSSYKSWR